MVTPATQFNNYKNENKTTFAKEIKFIIKKQHQNSDNKSRVPALSYNLFTDAFFLPLNRFRDCNNI